MSWFCLRPLCVLVFADLFCFCFAFKYLIWLGVLFVGFVT